MTVREKIDILLARGALLMECPERAISNEAAFDFSCAHRPAEHDSLLDFNRGMFEYLYDPAVPPPTFLPGHRKYYDPKLSPQVLRRVEGCAPMDAVERADHTVFGGCCRSEVLDAALRSETMCFVFEPDADRFFLFLASLDVDSLVNSFFIVGSEVFCEERIDTIFDAPLFTDVYPVFFEPEGAGEPELSAIRGLFRRIEVYYFRRKIYPLIGHGARSVLPGREIRRELFYDQQKHVYENLPRYVTSHDLSVLRGILPKTPALIAAAGPGLDEGLDFIRAHQGRAVLICLNNALRTLVSAGIRPDLVVVVDPSVDVEACFEGVRGLERTILVAHNYAFTAGGMFERVVFFGESLPVLRRPTPSLSWHGSVLSVGHALAEWMGCPGCVLIGAQLCSESAYGMAYTRCSVHGDGIPESPDIPDVRRLIPVRTVSGRRAYTSHNFLDAAVWLNRVIKRGTVPVGVLSDFSLLEGSGSPNEIVALGRDPEPVLDTIRNPDRPVRRDEAVEYAKRCLNDHRSARKLIEKALGPGFPFNPEQRAVKELWEASCARAADTSELEALMRCFEADNTAHLVSRFSGWPEIAFSIGMTMENGGRRRDTLCAYLSMIAEMSGVLEGILKKSLTALHVTGRSK